MNLIPYVVYDPRTANPTVTLKVDGLLVSELHLSNPSNVWSYKTDVVTIHTLTITCRNKTVTIRVDISELGYNIQPVTANLDFDFNPTGITNSSARETVRAAYTGSNRQKIAGKPFLTADTSFFFTHSLPMNMDFSPVGGGGYSKGVWGNSRIKAFAETRVFKSLPKVWQSAIKNVNSPSVGGDGTSNIYESNGHMYLPSIVDVKGGSGGVLNEQPLGRTPYFSSQIKQIMFNGIIVEDRDQSVPGRKVYSQSEDPSRDGYKIRSGDVWITGSTAYLFVSEEDVQKHSFIGNRITLNSSGLASVLLSTRL